MISLTPLSLELTWAQVFSVPDITREAVMLARETAGEASSFSPRPVQPGSSWASCPLVSAVPGEIYQVGEVERFFEKIIYQTSYLKIYF